MGLGNVFISYFEQSKHYKDKYESYLTLGSTHNARLLPLAKKYCHILNISIFYRRNDVYNWNRASEIAAKIDGNFNSFCTSYSSLPLPYLFKIVPEAQEHSLWTLNLGKTILQTSQKPPIKVNPGLITTSVVREVRLAQLVRRLHAERVAVVRFSLLLFFFNFAHAQCCGRSMRTWRHFPSTTWVTMPKSITSSSIPEFVNAPARPWLPPCGTESWPARTPWVEPQGFFSGRGKPLVLWRGTGERPLVKRKEDCRNSWRCLRSTWKRTTCWTLAWISSNPLWGVPFLLGQKLREG